MRKAFLVLLTVLGMSMSTFGQGTVSFGNTSSTLVTDNGVPVTSAQGAKVELLWAPAGTTDLNLFQVAGAAVSVGATTAGRFFGGTRTVGYTGDGNHGGIYAMVVRAYIGTSWQTATDRAWSAIFNLDTGDPTSIPGGTPTTLWSSGGFTGMDLNPFYPSPVTIWYQPVSQIASGHGQVTLNVAAFGAPAPSYQWYFNGELLTGATSSYLVITNLWTNNLGAYYVRAWNDFGTATSTEAYVYMSPTITTPYAGGTVSWGQATTLKVSAIGSGVLSYQWYFGSNSISGATNSSFSIASATASDSGMYSVRISSAYGSVTNPPGELVVYPTEVRLGMRASLTIGGTVGYTYEIQYTTDLIDTNAWITATNLTLSTPVETWVDRETEVRDQPKRYYRVLPH